MGTALANSLCVMGISSCRTPSTSYATQTGTSSIPVSTSSLVSTKSVTPLIRAAYRAITASNQPQRRGRPVVVPNSAPASRRRSPLTSSNSVGNGPSPTRVVYALTIAITPVMRVGGIPLPVHAPPAVAFDEVTNGYVPWSTSSWVACPASRTTVRPSASILLSSRAVSATIGRSRSAYPSSSSTTTSTSKPRRL